MLLSDCLRASSVKIGTTQRRLAWPLPSLVPFFFTQTDVDPAQDENMNKYNKTKA